jgi:hypothetical protein
MHKLRKTLIILFSCVIILVVVVILCISPVTKYLVEKYDVKFTGRQIKMDWAYVNPFSGYIHFENLKIFELKSDSVFFSAKGISANISMQKLLSKTYEIQELTINKPYGIIIQNDKELNFRDIIDRFSTKSDSGKAKSPVRLNILKIKIVDGLFYYCDKATPVNYFLKKVNIESTGMRWDTDTIRAKFSFLSGIGSGGMKGNFTINIKNEDYRLAVIAQKFDLNILEQYLTDLTNYGKFSANIDADLNVTGNFKEAQNVSFEGLLAINDFHFGKNSNEDYGSFNKLTFAIYELSPINHKYLFDSVSLNHPYFEYEIYDHMDNLETMFGQYGGKARSNTSGSKFNLVLEIGNYIKALSKNFFRSDYKLNRLAIYKGDLKFNNYSLSEIFAAELNPITLIVDSVNKKYNRAHLTLRTAIKPYGSANLALSVNPKDSSDFDLHYQLQNLPAALFNPYIISRTSYPLDRGTIEISGNWRVRNGIIKSDNHLLVIDPRVSARVKNKDTKWMPVWLVMAFARERGNVIDYEIPITGDLKNPKFHLHNVLMDVLKNMFVKPATTPYRIQVKTIETEIEKSLSLKWEMHHSSLMPDQERFIERMADFLEKNPDAVITVIPQLYAKKEKEYITYFEAKKKYFLAINNKNTSSFTRADSAWVDKMSIRDASFARYLNKHIDDSLVFTIQEKCSRFIGASVIEMKFNQLNNERANALMNYFRKKEVAKQIKFSKGNITIPYNGFSFYKIEYKGSYPEKLIAAYRKMNQLNKKAPRKKFSKEREKNRKLAK